MPIHERLTFAADNNIDGVPFVKDIVTNNTAGFTTERSITIWRKRRYEERTVALL